jgi:hypothetical protein
MTHHLYLLSEIISKDLGDYGSHDQPDPEGVYDSQDDAVQALRDRYAAFEQDRILGAYTYEMRVSGNSVTVRICHKATGSYFRSEEYEITTIPYHGSREPKSHPPERQA